MKIKAVGHVAEIRRIYDAQHAGFDGRVVAHVTHGWMAKVVFSRGVLNSEPIDIPLSVEDHVGPGDIVEIEMTITKRVDAK